ncbi:MAG: Magnesium chelatase, subunit ChlI [Methanobacterium sp. PtaU1.Bin242]|nr:MAG: Magnesium chelatase, subunit ChlI [Methanobacterium sp. PtaU1.Bin242]
MDYYHGPKMESLFEKLKQPRNLEELRLSENFIKDLILKIISGFGTIKTSGINEITGIHWDIMEIILSELEKSGFCAPIGGGFLFSSVQYTITKKGREKVQGMSEENPYIGIAPVSYEQYVEVMESQMKDRFPIKIPPEVIEDTFHDVVGVGYAKECMIESCTIGKGIFVYGPPGTGKTFIVSKMPHLLPPLIIPKYIEFGGRVIQLYDSDFHKKCSEQPQDPRWVKIHAPFVLTGAELSLNKLETNYNPNKGVYETSPIIKANGGILLIDDLGRQRDDHEIILNRLIVPMENKKDVIYVRGIPVIVHSHFIPAFSTNLDISIMDEAHLRRAPLHIFLKNPELDDVVEVFKRNLKYVGEDYEEDVLERFKKVYDSVNNGGEGLEPSFAHARDVAQITQAVRITQDKDIVDVPVLEESLNKHVLIVLQRMNIDIAEIANRTRTFRVETSSVSDAYNVLSKCNPIRISSESNAVIVDLEDNKTPVEIAEYLKEKNVPVDRIDVVAESDKELRRTILEHRY